MASPVRLSTTFRFGRFTLDASTGELRKSGIPIKLRLQAVEVLLMLAERAGHVVTREEIRDRLWSKDTFVDFERSINFCINQIRAALGDDADRPRYVQTLPRRGYRFTAPVTVEVSRTPAPLVQIASSDTESLQTGKGTDFSAVQHAMQVVTERRPVPHPGVKYWRMWLLAAAGTLAVLLAGFLGPAWLSRPGEPNLQDFRIVKLTNSGAVTGLAISPDGRYVAYAKLERDKQGLWLRQIASQNDVQILTAGTGFHGLTFSPDGNFIYFVRSDERNPWFKYLFSMPAVGGPVKKLLTDVDSPVSFSPDGRKVVYEHCVENRDDIELRMADADGNDDHAFAVIHNGSSMLFQPGPSWSPDGRTIAVPAYLVGPNSRWVLDTVSLSDGKVRELLTRDSFIGRPVWLQGGSLLVPLYNSAEHSGQLWTLSFPEGKSHRLTNELRSYGADSNDYGFPLDATKDRRSFIALTILETDTIWIASTSQPGAETELAPNDLALTWVTEATDGRLWAVSSVGQLWILSANESQAARYGNYEIASPIANCGPFMVIDRKSKAGAVTLTRLDLNAHHAMDLATGNFSDPACSPDGKYVFYASAEQPQKIWRVAIDGGAPLEIDRVLGDQLSGGINLSPDGRLISYGFTRYFPAPEWNAAVIPAQGGPPQKTFPLPPAEDTELHWSSDGKALQFLWTREGVTNLWEQPLGGGRPHQLTHFTSGRISAFSWSSDRKRLFLSRSKLSSDAVLLTTVH